MSPLQVVSDNQFYKVYKEYSHISISKSKSRQLITTHTMYYDDRFDPNLENEYDTIAAEQTNRYAVDSDDGECGSSIHPESAIYEEGVVNKMTKRASSKKRQPHQNRTTTILSNVNPGFFSVKKRIGGKLYNIDYYASPINPDLRVRNAVSGIYDTIKAGSRDTDILFKVTLTTGSNHESRTPQHLYYDSPEQYELHFGCSVPTATKQKWHERRLRQ